MKPWFDRIVVCGTLIAALLATGKAAGAACTHYASPSGTGNGSSSSQPFKIANFWAVAKAGTTLCLLDGAYTGSASMINPPQNMSGIPAAPITIRALNDGKVTINGQGTSRPVRLYYNNYFVIEGVNAYGSSASVVELSNSSYNVIRRVTAWDAADNNTNVFGVHNGTNNLLEDIAGWGIARKIISASQGGNYTTIRRAWARWEGSHVIGPKMTYALAYNNYNVVCENCIGAWSGERMKQTYTLLDYYGQPWTGNGAGTYTDYGVNQPVGIFATDRLDGDKNANLKLLGSIAYVRGSDRFAPAQAVLMTAMDSIEVSNAAIYLEPGSHLSKKRFSLYNLGSSAATNLSANHLTGIGGAGSIYGSEWKKSYLAEGSSLSSVPSVFSSTSGANLCKRYQNRAPTDAPLWPWPMNQRIIDALIQSGRSPVDVTATVERMFGAIPASCKAPGAIVAPPVPSAPLTLVVAP